VLDRTLPDEATRDFAQLPGEPGWSFISVPELKTSKNRVHVDLDVADLAAAVDRFLALGASRVRDFDEGGFRWTTLTDPEGNEFDVVAAT
jgi:predicted enzyme related to lactoylglutathione lyase